MSSRFTLEWLDLREPADDTARNGELVHLLRRYLPVEARDEETDFAFLRILDLAAGSGATARALSGFPADWYLFDKHTSALSGAHARMKGGCYTLVTGDVATDLSVVIGPALHAITTSAFLDLVGRPWLDELAGLCALYRLPFYAALTVDGRLSALPEHPLDGEMFAAFNRHMRRPKGVGQALGPDAAPAAAGIFAGHGFTVTLAPADWRLDGAHAELQRRLVAGWAGAIAELVDAPTGIEAWRAARLAAIDAGTSRLTVGHLDLLALPPS